MKKSSLILFTALMVLSLFAGCRRQPEPVPTYPPATAPVRPEPTATMPAFTRETEESTLSPTIEDGNGPIASQQITEETK